MKRKTIRKASDPAARIAALEARQKKISLQLEIQKLKQQYREANKK